MHCITSKAHILSNLLQLQNTAVAYVVVVIDLWTVAPPYKKLKKETWSQSQRSSTWFSFGLWNRHPPSRDIICFRWPENLVKRKCDSAFNFFCYFHDVDLGQSWEVSSSYPCRRESSSLAFGHDDVSSLS